MKLNGMEKIQKNLIFFDKVALARTENVLY